ncbi:MAG: type II toxin-antitoxin system Phd/YefM family antitoxin [Owenweeksia sp.]|nr:type II toxin-antitoxin system Phd/YefM family antitoxin [Owenweeksia sp.]
MEITNLTDFRRNMKAFFEKVFSLKQPLFIARPRGEDMVLMSKSEYESMQETFYLLRSPKDAERLRKAIDQDKAGKGIVREISGD